MTRQDRPAGANVHYLEQGVEPIRRLSGETYSNCPESPYPGAVSEQLAGLSAEHLERPVRVRAEEVTRGAPEWGSSSPARELQFLVSHTIHHYALSTVMLKTQAWDIGQEFPDFGLAPSTLSYWKEVAS